MKKMPTIRKRIFVSYAVLFTMTMLILLLVVNIYMENILQKRVTNSLAQMAVSIVEQTDNENEKLFNLALNLCSSEPLRNLFFEENVISSEIRRNRSDITDLVLSIAGPTAKFHRIIIRRQDGLVYDYSSREISFAVEKVENSPQYVQQTLKLKGVPLFISTYEDKSSLYYQEIPVIGIGIAFALGYGNKYENMIEIQQKYDVYESIICEMASSSSTEQDGYKTIVYDQNGNIVYPYEEKFDSKWWDNIQKSKSTFLDERSKREYTGQWCRSELSGWTVLVLEDIKEIRQPVYTFRLISIFLATVILGILLFITFFISKSITEPIKKIRELIKKYDIGQESNKDSFDVESGLDELTSLSNAFFDMQDRIQHYVDELIIVKMHDLQSQFSALQAQMNPHFIYNSLSHISIMCEEAGNPEIAEYCQDFAGLIRYGASNYLGDVSLEEEVSYLQAYLKILQKRYEGMLDTDVFLNQSLRQKKIPKLILQPIVENSIKYGLTTSPPWFISVEIDIMENGFFILISDTGVGFTQEKQEQLLLCFVEIEKMNGIPEMKPGGMGLINIYIRLRFLYQERVHIMIGNQEEGGAFVKILIKERCEDEAENNY